MEHILVVQVWYGSVRWSETPVEVPWQRTLEKLQMLWLSFGLCDRACKLALNMHIDKIHIETDSHTAFKILCRKEVKNQTHRTLLMDILALLSEFEDCWIGFSYTEANKVADRLANFGKKIFFFCIKLTFYAPMLYFGWGPLRL